MTTEKKNEDDDIMIATYDTYMCISIIVIRVCSTFMLINDEKT